ncbi:formin-binding protein 1-like isoform X2 [Glandiceps talaboti]
MSWGTELWDQYEVIEKHTKYGIEFVEKYHLFVKDRCRIENEYAAALRKLAKSYTPKKKENENGYTYTWSKQFANLVKEVGDLAGQHEVISESLTTDVVRASEDLVKELKSERKKFLQEGTKVHVALAASLKAQEQARKSYEAAHKASENAKLKYSEAEADMNLPRAQVEKARGQMNSKMQVCEDCKNEYLLQLENTNTHQRNYYSNALPQVFKQLQDLDEHRIDTLAELYKKFADDHRNVLPIVTKCLDCITVAGNAVDHAADSQSVIDRYKTGLDPPDDIVFIDLSKEDDNVSTGSGGNTGMPSKSGTLTPGGTTKAKRKKERRGIIQLFHKQLHSLIIQNEEKEDFSDLPPNQRRKKLQQKIDDFTEKLENEMKTRDALNKMKDVYTKNPALGDPNSVDTQLNKNGKELDMYRTELQKYQMYLDEMDGKSTPQGTPKKERPKSQIETNANLYSSSPSGASSPSSSTVSQVSHRTSTISQGSSLVSPQAVTAASPQAEVDTSVNSSYQDEFDEDIPEPTSRSGLEMVLFRSKVLYDFQSNSDGAMAIAAGEVLDVIERDSGDGWTKVRRGGNEEGYVPTSYIEVPS